YTYDPVVVDVPEPATLATMMAGLGLIGVARRRRAAKKV
ncbi:PEP-CTERM sorting domain-containing protein, partial [Acinetobacter baumannii]|nr:PEP-CTERM sorting domain-containing protein [Acinetobacter baumannii]